MALAACTLVATANSLAAQVVQLPTFSMFSVDTTVSVPDSGGAHLGGTRRGSHAMSTFGGIPRNRGWGVSRQAAGAGVTVQIHDPQEAEAALAGSSVRRHDAVPGPRRPLRIAAGEAASDAPLASVAELQERRAALAAAGQQEALALAERGRTAHRAGKNALAALYFRTAARKASGSLRQAIEAELRAIEATAAKAPARSAKK
jgi:hypothetical protein